MSKEASNAKRCTFWRAQRELAEFFQITNRSAEAKGQKVIYRTEFVAGWETFAANPCYATAVSFLVTFQPSETGIG